MEWEQVVQERAAEPACGYQPGQSPAAEPTAFAALLLAAHGRHTDAEPALAMLLKAQSASGAVMVRTTEDSPGWPTSLAILAWLSAEDPAKYSAAITKAKHWLLEAKGTIIERSTELGHNSELLAWSWAENTHSWVEPTALHIVALKALGLADHPRVREGVAMLIDRQLETGGWNYGNTTVLGQLLRPHQQPSGTALLALADEKDPSGRLTKSQTYLQNSLSAATPATSLSFSLLGLGVYKIVPAESEAWLVAAMERVMSHDKSPYKQVLLALAAHGKGIGPFRKSAS